MKGIFIDFPEDKRCPYCRKRLYRFFPFHYCKVDNVLKASQKSNKVIAKGELDKK